jgi:hypothetical protein
MGRSNYSRENDFGSAREEVYRVSDPARMSHNLSYLSSCLIYLAQQGEKLSLALPGKLYRQQARRAKLK